MHEIGGLAVNGDFAFSNKKGVYIKGIESRQTKQMTKIATHITPFLQEGESLQLVTGACSPMSLLEQWTTGWIIFYIKQALLVFTDRRILHIPTKSGYRYRNSIAQIDYKDIASAKMRGGSLKIVYKTGKKENFYYVNRHERAKLKAWLMEKDFTASEGSGATRTHMCPRCTQPLSRGAARCAHCSLEFKNMAEGTKYSWLIPGGGYFYVGRWFLGLGDAMVEGMLILVMIAAFVDLIAGEGAAAEQVISMGFVGFILLLEKLITVYHTKHFISEFIPKDKEVQVLIPE